MRCWVDDDSQQGDEDTGAGVKAYIYLPTYLDGLLTDDLHLLDHHQIQLVHQ